MPLINKDRRLQARPVSKADLPEWGNVVCNTKRNAGQQEHGQGMDNVFIISTGREIYISLQKKATGTN